MAAGEVLRSWLSWATEQVSRIRESPEKTKYAVAAVAAVVGTGAAVYIAKRLFRRKRRVLGVIPSRWDSARFQGKPLALILGKPMIRRTWENAKLSKTLTNVVIATDDERISKACRAFGAEVVLTSSNCLNGTERCAEALKKIKGRFDMVVNIQGDEPLLDPQTIDAAVLTLERRTEAAASTAVADLEPRFAADPNRVKCIVDYFGNALYFSRALIPHNKFGVPSQDYPYMKHIGVYCFRTDFLRKYPKLPRMPLEVEEDLEQLRILETGYTIAVVKVKHTGCGVDVPADVKKVEDILRKRG